MEEQLEEDIATTAEPAPQPAESVTLGEQSPVRNGPWCFDFQVFLFEAEQAVVAPDIAVARDRLVAALAALDRIAVRSPDPIPDAVNGFRPHLLRVIEVSRSSEEGSAVIDGMAEELATGSASIDNFVRSVTASCVEFNDWLANLAPASENFGAIVERQ